MKSIRIFGIALTSLYFAALSAETKSADKLRFATVGVGCLLYTSDAADE